MKENEEIEDENEKMKRKKRNRKGKRRKISRKERGERRRQGSRSVGKERRKQKGWGGHLYRVPQTLSPTPAPLTDPRSGASQENHCVSYFKHLTHLV